MKKQKIKVILIPTSKLLNDDYYYFGNSYKDTLNLFTLDDKLEPLSHEFDINEINIHGPLYNFSDFYFESLYNILKYYTNKVSVTTNLLKYTKGMINCPDIINVMYNFNDTINEDQILKNITALSNEKVVNLKSVDIYLTVQKAEIIKKINKLGIKSFEIIPYHQYINGNVKFTDYSLYESIVTLFSKHNKEMKFSFQNLLQINGIFNPKNYTTETIFILPNNNYGIISFISNKWYFKECDDIQSVKAFLSDKENIKLIKCNDCSVKNRCMANYFTNYEWNMESCSGSEKLIKKSHLDN